MKTTGIAILFALILSSCAGAEMVGKKPKPNVIPDSTAVCTQYPRGWSPDDPYRALITSCDVVTQYPIPIDPTVSPGYDCADHYVFIPPVGLYSRPRPDPNNPSVTIIDPNTYQVFVSFNGRFQNNGKWPETVWMDNQPWTIPPTKGADFPVAWSDWVYWKPAQTTNCSTGPYGCGVQGTSDLQNGFGICAQAGYSDLVFTGGRVVGQATVLPPIPTNGANR